jgi:hypothetical protein
VASARSDEEDVMLLPLLLFVVVDDPDDTDDPDDPDDPDDDEAVPEDPEVAWVVVVFDAVLVPLVPLPALVCVEPGRTAATAPAPITLAIPTPAVAAASRRIPRRRNVPGGIGRSAGLTGIVAPFGPGWPAGGPGNDFPASAAKPTLHGPALGALWPSSESPLNVAPKGLRAVTSAP